MTLLQTIRTTNTAEPKR